jgi:hypothetical protein
MFKRATWLGVGFTIGVGTTVVAARKARQQLDRYKPNAMVDRVTTTITDKASNLRDQVSAALDDGKQAAKDREQELRTDRFDRVTQTKTVETQTIELHTVDPPTDS